MRETLTSRAGHAKIFFVSTTIGIGKKFNRKFTKQGEFVRLVQSRSTELTDQQVNKIENAVRWCDDEVLDILISVLEPSR